MPEATVENAAAAKRMNRNESILYKRMWVASVLLVEREKTQEQLDVE
jgi:hypothetical protein